MLILFLDQEFYFRLAFFFFSFFSRIMPCTDCSVKHRSPIVVVDFSVLSNFVPLNSEKPFMYFLFNQFAAIFSPVKTESLLQSKAN